VGLGHQSCVRARRVYFDISMIKLPRCQVPFRFYLLDVISVFFFSSDGTVPLTSLVLMGIQLLLELDLYIPLVVLEPRPYPITFQDLPPPYVSWRAWLCSLHRAAKKLGRFQFSNIHTYEKLEVLGVMTQPIPSRTPSKTVRIRRNPRKQQLKFC
jgi:hypothetical protein